MIRYALVSVLLTVFFILELGEASVPNLVLGVSVAVALVVWLGDEVFREPERSPPLATRAVWLVPFLGAVVGHVLGGTFRVATLVMTLDPQVTSHVVDVPTGERTRRGVAVTGLAMTLSPGSYLLDVDWKEETMYFHVVGVEDRDTTRENFQQLYDRYQKKVFP